MRGRFGNESDEYRKLRDELALAEIALREQREHAADLRRRLPLDQEIEDHVFRDARLSELFEQPDRPLEPDEQSKEAKHGDPSWARRSSCEA